MEIEGEPVILVSGVTLPSQITVPGVRFVAESHDIDWLSLAQLNAFTFCQSRWDEMLAMLRSIPRDREFSTSYGPEVRQRYTFEGHGGTIWRMFVARIVENFLVYLKEILVLILQTTPEALKSSAEVKVEFVLSHKSMDDLIASLAEQRVDRLTYEGMKEIEKYFSRLGLRLFDNDDEAKRANELIEMRNVIVHNREVVNDVFKRRVPEDTRPVGIRLAGTFETLCKDSAFLDNLVTKIDIRAAQKFALPRIPFAHIPT